MGWGGSGEGRGSMGLRILVSGKNMRPSGSPELHGSREFHSRHSINSVTPSSPEERSRRRKPPGSLLGEARRDAVLLS